MKPALSLVKRPELLPFSFGATALGWHQIQPFTICPKEFQFARVRGIKMRGNYLKEPLSYGLALHVCRAQWFYDEKKGDLWKKALEKYVAEYEAHEHIALAPGTESFALSVFGEYVKYWSVRPQTISLAAEYEIKPRALVKDAPQWAWRGARLDSVEKWRNLAWIGELKSTSNSPSKVHDLYILNGQTMLQAALWGPEETEKFGPLGGILLDIIVKPSGKKPARAVDRIPLRLAQMEHALTWFRRDFTTWVMQSSLIRWNDTVERRPVCMRPHGPCDFRDLCLKGHRGSIGYTLKDGTPLSKWKPSEGKEVPPWI